MFNMIYCRYFGDKKLEPSDKIIMENVENKYTILLKETVPKQQGTYKVKAINEAGEMTAMAKLKVKRKRFLETCYVEICMWVGMLWYC